MTKTHSDNKRLFVTEDINNKDVYFAKTEKSVFARFKQIDNEWEVWLYPYKTRHIKKSFTEVLDFLDRIFKKYWEEIGE